MRIINKCDLGPWKELAQVRGLVNAPLTGENGSLPYTLKPFYFFSYMLLAIVFYDSVI